MIEYGGEEMGPATQKLVDISSPPFLPSDTSSVAKGLEQFGFNGVLLNQIHASRNGFFCFEAALRIFPSINCDSSLGIFEWNKDNLWKGEYNGLADQVFCFAEDIFANQFCIYRRKIACFNSETGDIEKISTTIEEWASQILENYDEMTGYPFAHEWQKIYGRMADRHRLIAKRPFVLGGEYELSNFASMDSLRIMKSLGNLAHQIHDSPDGSQVELKIL
jgi:hypothetical protein